MKRHSKYGKVMLMALAVALAFALAACDGATGEPRQLDLQMDIDLPSGFVTVGSKDFSAGSGNDTVVTAWKYQAIPTTAGANGAVLTFQPLTVTGGTSALLKDIAQGEWTIKVEGYNAASKRILHGATKKYLTVADKAILVKVNIPTDAAAVGNISATVKWDKNISSKSKLTVATRWQNPGTQHILGGGVAPSMEAWTAATEATMTEGGASDTDDKGVWNKSGLKSGTHMVQFLLYDGTATEANKVAGRVAVARVIDGSTTTDADVRLYAGQFIDMNLSLSDLTSQATQGYIAGAQNATDVISVKAGTSQTFTWTAKTGNPVTPDNWAWYVDGKLIQETKTATLTWTPVGSGTAYMDCIAYHSTKPGSMGGCFAKLKFT